MPAAVGQRFTSKKRAAFLQYLAESGNVLRAAQHVHMSRRAVYDHRHQDVAFARAWDAALAEAMDTVLEPEAVRRAVQGVLKPVYYQGDKVGVVREYSDTLLIFLLKGGKPDKYKDRLDIQHKVVITLLQKLAQVPTMTDAELDSFYAEVQAYVNQHAPA